MNEQLVFKFKKTFQSGYMAGLSVYESMPFVSAERARAWRNNVNRSHTVNYTVSELTEQGA